MGTKHSSLKAFAISTQTNANKGDTNPNGTAAPRGQLKKPSTTSDSKVNQHGVGPYERTKPSCSSIPYVGKKRPAGVLKAPDSRASQDKNHSATVSARTNEMSDPKTVKKKILPPKAAKRMSIPNNKSQGYSDLSKIDSPRRTESPSRRQTIGTPDSSRPNSKQGLSKKPIGGIRPRSCVMTNHEPEVKKPEARKISRSLQNIPKSIPGLPTNSNKSLVKKEIVRKSGSTDDISNCSKRTVTGSALKKPTAGVIPRTKSGSSTSKFGYGKPASKFAPSAKSQTETKTVNRKIDESKLDTHSSSNCKSNSPETMSNTPNPKSDLPNTPNISSRANLTNGRYESDGVSDSSHSNNHSPCSNNEDQADTKTINIIINLDTATGTQMNNNILSATATLNEKEFASTPQQFNGVDISSSTPLKMNSSTPLKVPTTTTETMSNTIVLDNGGNNTFHIPDTLDNFEMMDEPQISEKLNNTHIVQNDTQIISNDTHIIENDTHTMQNDTHIVQNDSRNMQNDTHVMQNDSHLMQNETFDRTRNVNEGLNRTHTNKNNTFDKTYNFFDTPSDKLGNNMFTRPNDTLDKTDSGFDDINYFLNSETPKFSDSINKDLSYEGDLSNDVRNVIAAISNNINRPTNVVTFSDSKTRLVSEDSEWLNDSHGPILPRYETSISQTSQEDEIITMYQTDELLSKSTNIEVFTETIDGEDTDISQSTDMLRNRLSSIGTDTEDIDDIELYEETSVNNLQEHHTDTVQDDNISSSLEVSSACMFKNGRTVVGDLYAEMDDIEIPTSIECSMVTTAISENSISHYTTEVNIDDCNDSISKEIEDALILDSGHSADEILVDSGHSTTDMNENELNAEMSKLDISRVKADLFSEEPDFRPESPSELHKSLSSDGARDFRPGTPPELRKSMSSDGTYPSTPLSRLESLECDTLSSRCNTIDCTRRTKKVARSRTYSSSELITKFRVPKELKCVETSDGDILLDKTTFLHFLNEVKVVKTQLLKLKRALVEAPCTSPLVKSPLKRTNSAVEASAVPPLSPRTCQCSPMAVVNPLVHGNTGSVTSVVKERENVFSLEEQVAMMNEKLQDNANTIKLLQTQVESHEQKEKDIVEENILLREEISQLNENIRKEGDGVTPRSFDDFDLPCDLDSRLSILQRLYTDG